MIKNPNIAAHLVARRLIGVSENQHPRLMTEITSGNWFNNFSIHEEFSDEVKIKLTELIENDEPIPVDKVLGEYWPKERKITIYVKAIEKFSARFNMEKEYVESIVRIHEYAHAIFHLGCESENPIVNTDDFLRKRSVIFNNMTSSFHEWIAQALCYSVLCRMELNTQKETFKEMMIHQPAIYQMDISDIENMVKNITSAKAPWSFLWAGLLEGIRIGKLVEPDFRDS